MTSGNQRLSRGYARGAIALLALAMVILPKLPTKLLKLSVAIAGFWVNLCQSWGHLRSPPIGTSEKTCC